MNYKGDIYYIDQVLKGEVRAFEYIVERHKDNVFNLAHKICISREDAEEVAQDSFLKAYRSLSAFNRMSSFSTWLYRIVYNTSVSSLRSKKKTALLLEDFPAEISDFTDNNIIEDSVLAEYRKSVVNFAMAKLEIEERAIITLYYYEDLSVDEIASTMGIGKNNVKVKMFRARKKMLEVIEKAETRNSLVNG